MQCACFARAYCSHATQLGQPVSCCRGSGSVLLQKWLNICYAVAQCRNLLKSSKICSCLIFKNRRTWSLWVCTTLLKPCQNKKGQSFVVMLGFCKFLKFTSAACCKKDMQKTQTCSCLLVRYFGMKITFLLVQNSFFFSVRNHNILSSQNIVPN